MIKYIAVFFAKNTNIHHRECRNIEIAEEFCESWNAQGTVYSSHVVTTPPMTYWDEIAKELPLSTEVTWIAYNPDELFGDSSEDLSDGESDNHVYDSETGSRDGEHTLAHRPPLRIIKILRKPAPLRVTRKAREDVVWCEIMQTPPPPVTSRIEQIVWYFTTQHRTSNTPNMHEYDRALDARTARESYRLNGAVVSQVKYKIVEGIDYHSQVPSVETLVWHFTTQKNGWDSPSRHEYDNEKDAVEAHGAFTACGAIVGLIKSSPVVVVDEFDDSVSPAPHVYTQPKTWIFTSSSGSIERSKHLCKSRDALEASRSRMMAAGYSVSEITEMVSIPARNLPIVKVFPANSRKFFAIPMNRRIKLARQRKYLGF